jgi:HlyD family secretion protein
MLAFNTILLTPNCRRPILLALTCWAIPGLLASNIGCTKPNPSTEVASPASGVVIGPPKRIYAQGQIMPAQGIIKLYTTPGDVVMELSEKAKVGTKVAKGEKLAVMRSEKTFESQLTTLSEQRNSAIREWQNAIKQAQLKLSAAQMKVQQVESQKLGLHRQSSLIEDAVKQIAASEHILQRLSNIAADSLTREFVGQLEVDRQRLTIDEARNKVAQQRSAQEQAVIDLELAAKVAIAEVNAAQELVEMAREADPSKAYEAQEAALQAEKGRSILRAPIDGVILAVHTSEGGSVVQTPLIELANLDDIVCELEVNTTQAQWIKAEQKVTIKSDSLPEVLTGLVKEISPVAGKPQLRSLDPLAAVDYRTLSVIVTLDKPELASRWLQLQVEAQIDLSNASRP